MQRQSFLRSAATAAASLPLSAFAVRAAAKPRPNGGGYGPLVAALDETTGLPLLDLPAGFRYMSLGWTGDPMLNGKPTPPAHDGMAAFPGRPAACGWSATTRQGGGTPFSRAWPTIRAPAAARPPSSSIPEVRRVISAPVRA